MLNFVKMFQRYKPSKFAPSGNRTRVAQRPPIHYIIKIAQRKWLPVKSTWKAQFLNQAQSNGFSTYSLVIDDFEIYNIHIL